MHNTLIVNIFIDLQELIHSDSNEGESSSMLRIFCLINSLFEKHATKDGLGHDKGLSL